MSSFSISSDGAARDTLLKIATSLPALESEIAKSLIETGDYQLLQAAAEFNESNDVLIVKDRILRRIVSTTVAAAHDIWAKLYENLTAERGKLLAQRAIDAASSADDKVSLTYGDIDFYSFANILQRLCIKEGEVFYDIGHGTGKAIICASLLYGGVLSACKGMEIVPELNEQALQVKAAFSETISNSAAFRGASHCELLIIEGDALEETCYLDWTSADIVFANSTCFSQSLMASISQLAERMRPGARFVTLTKQLQSDKFILADRRQYAMSWGEATCFVHIRKSLDVEQQMRNCLETIKSN